jgi:hypothetical protein
MLSGHNFLSIYICIPKFLLVTLFILLYQSLHRILVGRPYRRKDNIKINLRETGWGGMDWIHLALNRDHSGSIKCWEILE